MLHIIVTLKLDGRTVLDSIGPEPLVKIIAQRFQENPTYNVAITYP